MLEVLYTQKYRFKCLVATVALVLLGFGPHIVSTVVETTEKGVGPRIISTGHSTAKMIETAAFQWPKYPT